jgi:GNAT superfamily N-acetyltransferase
MSRATITPPAIGVRDATATDNDALVALAGACSMDGDIALRVTREPDFFQLPRLEGSAWRVGVAELDGRVVGSVMGAVRHAHLHGAPQSTLYVGDLKVHPSARRAGVADALSEWVRCALVELGGSETPLMVTILAGNRAMESRTRGRGQVPRFARFATMRAFSIPLLLPCAEAKDGLVVTPARAMDIEEMADLWRRVAPRRQFAPVFDAESLAAWIDAAPGLDITDYRVARDQRGRIVGFLGWWDQTSFKQLQVTRYSLRLRVVKAVVNSIARATGGVTLPAVGGTLPCRTAIHVCVPPELPSVLRALVRRSHHELRRARCALATIGLDVRDPLCSALDGLFAQPTDVNAYVCTPGGEYTGASLADRPLHYEIALV